MLHQSSLEIRKKQVSENVHVNVTYEFVIIKWWVEANVYVNVTQE
jgi:hypothetical protein